MDDQRRPNLRIGFVGAAVSLLAFGAALADDHDRPRSAVPTGLVAILKDTPGQPLDVSVSRNPHISGVGIQIHWEDLEPAEGKPDWDHLDALFKAAEANHKWVQLCIFPGFFSPAWALHGVKSDSFPIPYGPGAGDVKLLPAPWDSVYLRRWLEFSRMLAERYADRPAFRMMDASGPTSVSDEFTLPNSPDDLRKWQRLGYRPSKYLAAWKQVLEAYARDFPNQCVSMAAPAGCLPINEEGRIDQRERSKTRQAVVDAAIQIMGQRYALEMNDVHAGPVLHGPNPRVADLFVIGYIGKIGTGFLMGTNALRQSPFMGAAGDPPLALRRSIDLALQTNATGQHVDYVDIYAIDVAADQMQDVLRDESRLFPPPGSDWPPDRGQRR